MQKNFQRRDDLNVTGWSFGKDISDHFEKDALTPRRTSQNLSHSRDLLEFKAVNNKKKYLPPLQIQTDEIRVKSERPSPRRPKKTLNFLMKSIGSRPVSQPSIPSISTPVSSDIHINGSFYFPAQMKHIHTWHESVQKSLKQKIRDRREFASSKNSFRSPRESTSRELGFIEEDALNQTQSSYKEIKLNVPHLLVNDRLQSKIDEESSVSLTPAIGEYHHVENKAEDDNRIGSPLPSESSCHDRYSMRRRPRGYAVVINNYEFFEYIQSPNGHSLGKRCRPDLYREGAHVDKDLLEKLLGDELHFIVKYYSNVTKSDIVDIMTNIAELNHSQFDCFMCCLSSHGNEGTISGSDCKEVRIMDLTRLFDNNKCASLRDKPKCFFIQACQGNFHQKDVFQKPVFHNDTTSMNDSYFPQTSDILIGYSSVGGSTSFRHAQNGSVYIGKLVKYIRKYRNVSDVAHILTIVNKMVSNYIFTVEHGQGRQLPKIESTLRAALYFDN